MISHSCGCEYARIDLIGYGHDVFLCHRLGVNGSPLVKNGEPDACPKQTPGVAKASMTTNAIRRLKTVGLEHGTDAVSAPAPLQIGTLTGASAAQTAANHAHTASTKPSDGGGQHVPL